MPSSPLRRNGSILVLLLALPVAAGADAPRAPSATPGAARMSAPRRSAEELALLAIQDRTVQDVQAIVERMRTTPDGPAREALERQAVAIKEQGEVDFLTTKAAFARARGDLATALLAESLAARILHPEMVSPAAGAGDTKADPKGGAR